MSEDSLETKYLRTFGAVLSAAQTARILGYKSTASLAKARARGSLPFQMFLLPTLSMLPPSWILRRHRPAASRISQPTRKP